MEKRPPIDDRSAPRASTASLWSSAIEEFFRRRNEALSPFLELYDEAIHFEDPVHNVDGLAAFAETNKRFAERARLLDIEIGDVVEGGDVFFAAWTMRFAPRFGPRMTLVGATHARTRAGKLIYQRDHFDPVGGFFCALPGAGHLYRFLIRTTA